MNKLEEVIKKISTLLVFVIILSGCSRKQYGCNYSVDDRYKNYNIGWQDKYKGKKIKPTIR